MVQSINAMQVVNKIQPHTIKFKIPVVVKLDIKILQLLDQKVNVISRVIVFQLNGIRYQILVFVKLIIIV